MVQTGTRWERGIGAPVCQRWPLRRSNRLLPSIKEIADDPAETELQRRARGPLETPGRHYPNVYLVSAKINVGDPSNVVTVTIQPGERLVCGDQQIMSYLCRQSRTGSQVGDGEGKDTNTQLLAQSLSFNRHAGISIEAIRTPSRSQLEAAGLQSGKLLGDALDRSRHPLGPTQPTRRRRPGRLLTGSNFPCPGCEVGRHGLTSQLKPDNQMRNRSRGTFTRPTKL